MADTVLLPPRASIKGVVLLIANNTGAKQLLNTMLRHEGYSVICDSNRTSGFTSQLIENGWDTLVDVIVIDEPHVDHPGLPTKLCAAGINIPVVAVSVLPSRQKFIDAGYTAHITKPIDCRKLAKAIESHSSRRGITK